jgi:hypothetical protein
VLNRLYAVSKRGAGALAICRGDILTHQKLPIFEILLKPYQPFFGNTSICLHLIWFLFLVIFVVKVLTGTDFGPSGPLGLGPFEELFVADLLLCLAP